MSNPVNVSVLDILAYPVRPRVYWFVAERIFTQREGITTFGKVGIRLKIIFGNLP